MTILATREALKDGLQGLVDQSYAYYVEKFAGGLLWSINETPDITSPAPPDYIQWTVDRLDQYAISAQLDQNLAEDHLSTEIYNLLINNEVAGSASNSFKVRSGFSQLFMAITEKPLSDWPSYDINNLYSWGTVPPSIGNPILSEMLGTVSQYIVNVFGSPPPPPPPPQIEPGSRVINTRSELVDALKNTIEDGEYTQCFNIFSSAYKFHLNGDSIDDVDTSILFTQDPEEIADNLKFVYDNVTKDDFHQSTYDMMNLLDMSDSTALSMVRRGLPHLYLLVIDRETIDNLMIVEDVVLTWDYQPPPSDHPNLVKMTGVVYNMLERVFGQVLQLDDDYTLISSRTEILRLVSNRIYVGDQEFHYLVQNCLIKNDLDATGDFRLDCLKFTSYLYPDDRVLDLYERVSWLNSLDPFLAEAIFSVIAYLKGDEHRGDVSSDEEIKIYTSRALYLGKKYRVINVDKPMKFGDETTVTNDRIARDGAISSILKDHLRV